MATTNLPRPEAYSPRYVGLPPVQSTQQRHGRFRPLVTMLVERLGLPICSPVIPGCYSPCGSPTQTGQNRIADVDTDALTPQNNIRESGQSQRFVTMVLGRPGEYRVLMMTHCVTSISENQHKQHMQNHGHIIGETRMISRAECVSHFRTLPPHHAPSALSGSPDPFL